MPARATVGLPHDVQRVPRAERRPLPDECIYGPLSRILANMDGKKTLKELLLETEWETRSRFNPYQVKRYIYVVGYLGDWGYLDVRYASEITREEIVRALRQAGLKSGDLVLAHTGISHFGRIRGGADTVLDAFLEVLGEKGTLLLPAFDRPSIFYEGFGSKNRRYRPHEADRTDSVVTGRLAQHLMKRPGAIRSRHCSHSVVGIGPLAAQCLSEHREDDPPAGRRSPFGKLLDHGGKMAWFGAGLYSTTFFHFLETELDAPWLRSALCCVKEGGRVRTVFVPKHLPGASRLLSRGRVENLQAARRHGAGNPESRARPRSDQGHRGAPDVPIGHAGAARRPEPAALRLRHLHVLQRATGSPPPAAQ